MSDTILSLRNCHYSYERNGFSLEDISFDINAGRLYGIVGPNGSGKSTLMKIMTGIKAPDRGDVELLGRNVLNFSRLEFAREAAFLPQNPMPSYDLTVREVIGLGRFPYQRGLGFWDERDEEIVERTLQETESEKLADRFFSTLSGGERQRVLVASVLAQEPKLLLLDEPGAALDIHHKTHIFDLLWDLTKKHGIGVVVVTHDLNKAGEFCDDIILLSEGRVVEMGTPEAVMRDEPLSRVYDARLRVIKHPLTGCPTVNVIGKKLHSHNE